MEGLFRKLEQLLDAAERSSMSPKELEQAVTIVKQMKALGIDVPMRYVAMLQKFKGNEAKIVETLNGIKAPMLKNLLGLPEVAGGRA